MASRDFLKTSLRTGKYSDLTIECGKKTFHVHKPVVCTQSKPLAAMVDGGFLESETSVIKMVEDDPETVKRFLQFLYEQDYDDSNTLNVQPTVLPRNSAKRLRAPETPLLPQSWDDSLQNNGITESSTRKYVVTITNLPVRKTLHQFRISLPVSNDDIEGLHVHECDPLGFRLIAKNKEIAKKIVDHLEGSLDGDCTIKASFRPSKELELKSIASSPKTLETNTKVYVIADKYDVPALRSLAVEKIEKSISENWKSPNFSSSLGFLYTNTVHSDRALKDIFIRVAHSKQDSLLRDPQFQELLMEIGEIGLDLFKEKMKPIPITPVGPRVEFPCTREYCIREDCTREDCTGEVCIEVLDCHNCGGDEFHHIDLIEKGKQMDFICADMHCQTRFAVEDIGLLCSQCRSLKKRRRRRV